MSFYQPGTFGNVELYRFLNQNFGVKASPQTRSSLMSQKTYTTAQFNYNQQPRAASAAIGRMAVGACCSSCAKGGPCGG